MIEVVVADRGKARFFLAPTLDERMGPLRMLVNSAARKHERALASDSPGRVFNRTAGVHQSYGIRHQLRDDATRRFVRKITEAIAVDLCRQDCGGFVLIAAPRLLSQLKSALPRATRVKLIGGIAKELTNHAPQVIGGYLRTARRDGTLFEAQGN